MNPSLKCSLSHFKPTRSNFHYSNSSIPTKTLPSCGRNRNRNRNNRIVPSSTYQNQNQIAPLSAHSFSTYQPISSGSNKWSKIKHKKAAQDAIKGSTYGALSREILASIKSSPLSKDLASLPEHNSRLAYLLRKARDLDIPKEKIEATLAKSTNQGGGGEELVTYEVLGNTSHSKPFKPISLPNSDERSSTAGASKSNGGDGLGQPIALIIECSTDSTARTIAKLKECLNKSHSGWRLGNNSHLFNRIGRIWLNLSADSKPGEGRGEVEFEKIFELAVENGAQDVRWLPEEEWHHLESFGNFREKGERIVEIICPPSCLRPISSVLTTDYSILLSEQTLLPSGPTIKVLDSDEHLDPGETQRAGVKGTGREKETETETETEMETGGFIDEHSIEKLDKLAENLEESADVVRIFSNISGWTWPR